MKSGAEVRAVSSGVSGPVSGPVSCPVSCAAQWREPLATAARATARAVAPGSLVVLVSLASSARGQAVEHLIDGGFTGGADVIAVDVDLDGRPDIVGASYYSDVVSWWR